MFRKKLPLPPGKYRMGGKHFKNDKAFIKTAVRDVRRLVKYCDLSEGSTLLDWGCGAGRLAVGVREDFGQIRDYHGVDIQPELIEWANENLAGDGFRFTCLDVSNERYNPDGSPDRTLAAEPGTVDAGGGDLDHPLALPVAQRQALGADGGSVRSGHEMDLLTGFGQLAAVPPADGARADHPDPHACEGDRRTDE